MAVRARKIMWPVIEQHFDEAEYLQSQWERVLVDPLCDLARTEVWEDRFFAHLDGVVGAGSDVVEQYLIPAFTSDEPARACAATLAAFHAGAMQQARTAFFDALSVSKGRAGLARALCLARDAIEPWLIDILWSESSADIAMGLDILSFRRQATPQVLSRFLFAEDPLVMTASLRATRFLGAQFRPQIRSALTSEVVAVKYAGIEAGLLLGMRNVLDTARVMVDQGVPPSDLVLQVLAMSGEPADFERLVALLPQKALSARALFALGFTGLPRAIECSLPLLDDPRLDRIAAEVVTAISGLKIEKELSLPDEDVVVEANGEESDEGFDLVPGPEANLPRPNADAVRQAWMSMAHAFEPDTRYIAGMPLSAEAIAHALVYGPMRRRHALMHEVSVRTRGRFSLESRTWARDQRNLSALSALDAASLVPFEQLLTG